MRLPGAGPGVLLAGLMAEPEGRQVQPDQPLLGAWSATRWQYTRAAQPEQSVDVVADLGGMVTLSLGAGTWVLTWAPAGQGSRSTGGTFEALGEVLDFQPRGSAEPFRASYRQAADTLVLRAEDARWAFSGGRGEEPAGFVAVLVRL